MWIIADGAVKRFNAAKKKWGYGQVISLATFQNTNQGYIVQNACSFGAEIFIVKPAEQQEKVTFISNPPNNVFTWKVLRFSSLEDKFYYSDEFLVGDKILVSTFLLTIFYIVAYLNSSVITGFRLIYNQEIRV